MTHILVTGGTGYIGSHTVVELLNAGYSVTIIDNLVNSSRVALERIYTITGKHPLFVKADLADATAVDNIFAGNKVDAVIHFAALKAVGESTTQALRYWDNNLTGTFTLLKAMEKHKVFQLVFSSSATVYGAPTKFPLTEDMPMSAMSPYGQTKVAIELLLRDLAVADKRWQLCALRYFNPVGAHKSGLMGEDPQGIPNNLLPFVTQVAVGRRPHVQIFGNDYPTPDGTCIRDFIHVVDLAAGHLAALRWLPKHHGVQAFNLGTGKGSTVLQVMQAMSAAVGKELPYVFAPRRAGDIAEAWADVSKAKRELGWATQLTLQDACIDAWNWQQKNPMGYA